MKLDIVRDPKHEYRVNGEVWPGVTTILRETKLSSDWSTVPRQVLDAARDRGRAVHGLLWHLTTDPETFTWGDVPSDIFGFLEAAERYLHERGIARVIGAERLVAHPRLRYCGTIDLVAQLHNGTIILPDWKTGDPDDAGGQYQTAAYVEAHNENAPADEKIQERECVKLNNDGTYRVHAYASNPNDFRIFASALVTYRSHHKSWRKAS